jgi:hypothetical protein
VLRTVRTQPKKLNSKGQSRFRCAAVNSLEHFTEKIRLRKSFLSYSLKKKNVMLVFVSRLVYSQQFFESVHLYCNNPVV